jgi:hypothetical protein
MKLFLFFLFAALVICPEHGEKSAATGNRKFADKHWYCEYEHTTRQSVHKFWQECAR